MNNWFSYVIDHIFPETVIMQTLGLIWINDNNLIKNFSCCELPFLNPSTQATAFDCKGLIRSV